MQNQLYNILEKLIVKNNIQVNKEELKLQLSSHPSYPSLHALTGVLDHFNIPNLALRLTVNDEILKQLPLSFIANISSDQGDDLVLVEKRKKGIRLTSDHKKNRMISNHEFLEVWNGIIVAIEKDETIKETVQNPMIKLAKWAQVGLGSLFIIYLMYSGGGLFASTHFLLSIIGLAISVFIVKHELGLQSSAANSFCNLSQNTSCDDVLNSKGASIFGLFKLSDISIVVFSCYCFCWVLSFASNNSNFSIMSIVTLLAFPFIIYSLYYQYRVIKKWCPLCLAMALVLVLQIGVLFLTGFSFIELSLDMQSVLIFLLSVITSIGVWSFLKPLLKKKEALEKKEIDHYKFKRNFSVFNVLLNEADTLRSFKSIPGEISLGNREATIKLILVTSPFCYYCKKAHSDIEQLLTRIGDKVNLVIRFNTDSSNPEDKLYQVASRLLEIYNTQGDNEILQTLDEVYSNDIDLEQWLKDRAYDMSISYNTILETQSTWCKANSINFTPALYLDDKLFPNEYDRTDLTYFIDDLIAQRHASSLKNETAIAS